MSQGRGYPKPSYSASFSPLGTLVLFRSQTHLGTLSWRCRRGAFQCQNGVRKACKRERYYPPFPIWSDWKDHSSAMTGKELRLRAIRQARNGDTLGFATSSHGQLQTFVPEFDHEIVALFRDRRDAQHHCQARADKAKVQPQCDATGIVAPAKLKACSAASYCDGRFAILGGDRFSPCLRRPIPKRQFVCSRQSQA